MERKDYLLNTLHVDMLHKRLQLVESMKIFTNNLHVIFEIYAPHGFPDYNFFFFVTSLKIPYKIFSPFLFSH